MEGTTPDLGRLRLPRWSAGWKAATELSCEIRSISSPGLSIRRIRWLSAEKGGTILKFSGHASGEMPITSGPPSCHDHAP